MALTKITVDWKVFAEKLGGILAAELRGLLDGAEADLREYALAIAESLARNLAAGRDSLTAELKGQLRLLAETHRIKANAAGWDFFEQFATIAMRTVTGLLSAATGAALAGLPGAAAGSALSGGK